jgi:uncharacterized protein (DUF427 family)
LSDHATPPWQYTGESRPPFAETPRAGQLSVWDFPRPPAHSVDPRRVVVRVGSRVVAESMRTRRVIETASPPTFYLPPADVDLGLLVAAPGTSICEWKGRAAYWSVCIPGLPALQAVAWSYPEPRPEFAAIAGWFSFYPGRLHCEVDGERVRPQPGGFYGGWMTDEIAGPVKGGPGSSNW